MASGLYIKAKVEKVILSTNYVCHYCKHVLQCLGEKLIKYFLDFEKVFDNSKGQKTLFFLNVPQ